MWLFLWILFVLALIGFFVWSYHTTYEQKRSWRTFSERYNLQYVSEKMMAPPSVSGQLKNRPINLYAQQVEDAQGNRSMQTVLEVFLNDFPNLVMVVTSPQFSDFIAALGFSESFSVDDGSWPKEGLARTIENEFPEKWFLAHKDRVSAIDKLFKLPVSVAFLCNAQQAFIAVRTTNPLSDSKKLHQIIKKLYEIADLLEVKAEAKETKKEQEEVNP